MKKFLTALLIVGSLFFVSTAQAAIETYVGEGQATMGDTESTDATIDRARLKAIRNALEKAGVYITSQVSTEPFIKIIKTSVRRSMNDDGVIHVFVTVTVQIDSSLVETPKPVEKPKPLVDKPKPTTPIERPKPIETPAPPASDDTIKTYVGTDDYTVGQRETQEEAENHSKLRAIRNACEQAGIFIRSQSRSKDLELVEDEIISVAETIAKIVGKPEYKTEVLSDGRSTVIHTKVTVQIDTADLERRLEKVTRKHKR